MPSLGLYQSSDRLLATPTTGSFTQQDPQITTFTAVVVP